MRVIVTKDSWGIVVWKPDAVLEYERITFGGGAHPGRGPHRLPKWTPKDPVWMCSNCWFQGQKQLFSSKKCKKLFPQLGSDMQDGDSVAMELTFQPIQ